MTTRRTCPRRLFATLAIVAFAAALALSAGHRHQHGSDTEARCAACVLSHHSATTPTEASALIVAPSLPRIARRAPIATRYTAAVRASESGRAPPTELGA